MAFKEESIRLGPQTLGKILKNRLAISTQLVFRLQLSEYKDEAALLDVLISTAD